MDIQNLILIFFIIGNSILGLMIYRNNPKSWTNKLFTFLVILLTLYLTLNTQLYAFGEKEVRLFFSRFIIALGALINYAVFMFLTTFPNAKISLLKKYFYPITGATIALFLVGFTNLIIADVRVDNGVLIPEPGLLMPVFLVHTIGLVFGGIIASLFRLKKSTGMEKVKIRFVLVSFFALFSLIIALNFILAVFFQNGDFVPYLPIYIFIFNLLIAYAIKRHKLLDIKFLVGRAVMYALLLFALIVLYTVSVFGLLKLLPFWVDERHVFISMAIVVAFSFSMIQNFLEKVTRKILFRGHYDTEELLNKLTHVMASEIRVTKLVGSILEILTSEMLITKSSFIFFKEDQITNVEPESFGDKKSLQEKEGLLELTKGSDEIYVLEDLIDSERKNLFRKLDASVVMPLRVKNKVIGLLILGHKASGDIYSNQDLELLEIFAPQAAITLQNAESYRQVQRFSRTLERKVQERTKELKETQASELSKAKELLKIKDEFVFIATHDLGTPVTAIKGFTYLLERSEKNLSKKSREYIASLKEASERLSDLTRDLLQVAKSESGVIELDVEAVDVISLIKSTLKEVSTSAQDHKISLKSDFHAKKCLVLADKEKLFEVIENLLSNAVKYNKEKGQILIVTQLRKNSLQIDVTDTGIGIPKKDHSKIFQKFSRIHQDGTENIAGTGLGLFVVRMMVEKMKGQISFTSAEGEGTTFSLVLPLATKQALKRLNN